MKKLYQLNWYRYLLLPILAVISFAGAKAQTVVYADPALGSFDITNLSDVSVNANTLQQNSVYKIKLQVLNLDFTNAIPPQTAYVEIGLGSGFVLAPSFDLANAPYSNYFFFQYITTGSQPKIRCTLINFLPGDFDGRFVFNVKANTVTQVNGSTVTGNFFVNNNNPLYTLSDYRDNNHAEISYHIVEAGPLPVTLTSFDARNKNCSIDVNWSVAQEQNLSRYEVEVSKDGTGFVKAATVTAQNKPNYATSFAITDNLKSATLLVRLKSIDIDGSFKYSPIVSVSGTCAGKQQQDIYCYPNPVVSEDHITIASRGELFNGTYQVSLIDAAGKNYGNSQVVLSNTASFKYVFGNRLAAGNYFIVLHRADGTTAAVLQFVKY